VKRKIFITGAAGLVGTDVLQKISAESEHDITALYRNNKSINRNNIRWVQNDMTDPNIDLKKDIAGASVLIHNAAEINKGVTSIERERIQMANIDFTQRLFDWAIDAGVEKIILTSGLSLNAGHSSSIITEEDRPLPFNFYTASKLMNEDYLKTKAAKFGIQYNILRLSSPICFSLDRMPDTVVKQWIIKSLRNETIKVFGSGSRTQDFVSTTDIANAFSCCLSRRDLSGTFNIASGTTLSMLALAQLITSKFKNEFVHVNEDVKENERWNVSIDKAQKELGYVPVYSSKDCIARLLESILK
jgi:nucleoside-diphosphate-sugar epimerase